ncbi:hypothetical protein GQ457_12G012490 [Hibiscus cannabinus]
MGLLSNRIGKESLKPGDHIYSWRTAYIYAHHGIYVGNNTVIHFTRRGQEVGTGTVLDLLLVSSGPARAQLHCPTCTPPEEGLLVLDQSTIGQSGQAISIIGGPLAAVLSTPLRLVTTNIYGMAATAVGVYCASRYAADIGMRRDAVKVSVEDLTARLATGLLQVIEPQLLAAPAH